VEEDGRVVCVVGDTAAETSLDLSMNQSINHLLTIIKNTENPISTNDRYNQAETALIVDLKTHIK